MDIEIRYTNVNKDDQLTRHIHGQIEQHLGRHFDRLTRIEVHLGDENGEKSGSRDKRCMIEQRPRGGDPIAVEARDADLYTAISEASGKALRAMDRWVGKKEAAH